MTDAGADEPFHFVADLVEHPANLAIQSLLQNDAQTSGSKLLHSREPGAPALEENAGTQFFGQLRVPRFVEGDFVFLFHFVARMGEMLRKITVTGQKEEPFGLSVEPADIEEPGKLRRQQVVDCVSCVRIAPRGNKAGRLMQHNGQRLRSPNEPVTDLDVIALFDLGREISARLPVDRDPAFRDQLIAVPA